MKVNEESKDELFIQSSQYVGFLLRQIRSEEEQKRFAKMVFNQIESFLPDLSTTVIESLNKVQLTLEEMKEKRSDDLDKFKTRQKTRKR